MGVSPSRDFYKPHVERKQPDDNFHIASWGKIRFIQKFINILETWGSRCLVKMLNHMNFMNNSVYLPVVVTFSQKLVCWTATWLRCFTSKIRLSLVPSLVRQFGINKYRDIMEPAIQWETSILFIVTFTFHIFDKNVLYIKNKILCQKCEKYIF